MALQPGNPIPRRRWAIGVLLGSGILVSFLDRINLSVAGPQLQKALALDPLQMGYLFSAYSWTYTVLQIPVGSFVDRVGVTRIGRWGSFLWTLASGITAVAGGFWGIVAARLLLGVAEAPSFPTVSKATGHWFPRNERARATAIFDAAAKFSNVLGIPVIAFAVVRFGWRWGFAITSAISLVYFVAFYVLYRDPSADPHLARAEHDYILKGAPSPRALRGGGPGHAGLPPRPSPRSGAGHRVRGLRVLVLPVPDLASRVPRRHPRHEQSSARSGTPPPRGPWRP